MNIIFQQWSSKPISRRIKKIFKNIDNSIGKIQRDTIKILERNTEINTTTLVETTLVETTLVETTLVESVEANLEKSIKNSEHQRIIDDIEAIDLESNNRKIIFSGSLYADIFIIGERPEEKDEILGRPFLGECGKYLEEIFRSMKLNFRGCYLTNSIFWTTPKGRPPTAEEIMLCNPFLLRQINLVRPKIILLLGVSALKSISPNLSILEIRGHFQSIEILGNSYQFLTTFHPNYLLKSPNYRSLMEEDIMNLKNFDFSCLNNIEK